MTFVPDMMPMLSAGKHRSPRSGGCFMEIASFLAGARWSDHPKCTDATLAELARCVNDVMPDGARFRLSPLIPSVIGTKTGSRDERAVLAARIVRECSLVALPVVTAKARPLACALLVAEGVLGETTAEAVAALATQPDARAFALRCLEVNPHQWRNPRAYLSVAAPQAVRCAVWAVSTELGPDAPDVLVTMLARAIAASRAACGLVEDPAVPAEQWDRACALVGARPAAG